MYRKTRLEINETYLKENLKNIICEYDDYKYIFGVVKGNCYGHGEKLIKTMLKCGINYLAVSSLEEALSVRKQTDDTPILCFGYIGPNEIDVAIENNITITILSYDHYLEMKEIKGYKAHLKLNTGMNRVGVNKKEQVKEIKENIELEGIYTHFATSGVLDVYWDKQVKKFEELTSLINLKEIEIVHLYNSLSLVKHEMNKYANGVRLGIVMYGYSSSIKEPRGIRKLAFAFRKRMRTKGIKISKVSMSNNLKLKKLFTLKSEIININEVKKGDVVGYNAIYKVTKKSRIAVIPVGHADGVTKYYKMVEINNKLYNIVALTMDSIMVEVDNSVNVHDEVILFGGKITLASIAQESGISVHQALVSIGQRVPRVYIK